MALVVAGIGVGVGFSPTVNAEDTNCHESFLVADSETLASERDLDPGEIDIGKETISEDETMNVRLTTSDDELDWSVYRVNESGVCVEYTQSDCDGTPTLTSKGELGNCTLEIEHDDVFFLRVENVEPSPADKLSYKAWAD